MFFYLDGFAFGVEVVDGRHSDTSSSDAKGRVLDGLKLFSGRFADVRKPDCSCQSEKRADQGFEGC